MNPTPPKPSPAPSHAPAGSEPCPNPEPDPVSPRWRVGHRGRDLMYYEEWRGGGWQRLELDGEMLMGRAHHVIYFRSPEAWNLYPAWAHGRREEIISRVMRKFREPDYEYAGDPGSRLPPPTGTPARGSIPPGSRSSEGPAGPRGLQALGLAVFLLSSLSAGMAWLVWDGIREGETWYPTKKTSLRRVVARAGEPALYWVSIGLYFGIGTGSLGLAVWGVREGCRAS